MQPAIAMHCTQLCMQLPALFAYLQPVNSRAHTATHVCWLQLGPMAADRGDAKPDLVADLRAAGDILKRLESAIATIDPKPEGFTAPGAFMMQLLGRAGAPAEQARLLAHMLLTAATTTGSGLDDPILGQAAQQSTASAM